ncbi:MAG: lytic transglycosylase domain-containing protein, partial [Thermoanaerobaculia bacterium]
FEGDLSRILAGYNAGEATVERYEGVPPFRETRDYIRRVYALLGAEAREGSR